jgi:hypothetical protein
VLDQEQHRLLHVHGLNDVVVVEHQHDIVGEGGEVVEQAGDHRLQGGGVGLKHPQRVASDIGAHLLEGGDDIGPEHCRVAVTAVERQPRRRSGRPGLAGKPLGHQRGLAKAGRRRDQHDRRKGVAVQTTIEPVPPDDTPSMPGRVQLALEQGNPGRVRSLLRRQASSGPLRGPRSWTRRLLVPFTLALPAVPNRWFYDARASW